MFLKSFRLCLALLFLSARTFAQQVPILCYHQIRDWKPKDKKSDKDYIIPPVNFAAQMKMLSDSGYHSILPDQLYDFRTKGQPLPPQPVILTFDDTNADQFTAARPVLIKYHFKAVFFIITGKIGTHKWFMNAQQIKQLSDDANAIGCHTTNHHDFRKLKAADFQTEIAASKTVLENITGKPVDYFAFPFGEWNHTGLPELRKLGFKAAFALEQPRDPQYPLLTIRRLITPGYWSPQTLYRNIKRDFR